MLVWTLVIRYQEKPNDIELGVRERMPAHLVMYSVSNFFLRWLLVLRYHISSYQLCNHGRSEGKRLSHAQSCAEVTRGGEDSVSATNYPLDAKAGPDLLPAAPEILAVSALDEKVSNRANQRPPPSPLQKSDQSTAW